MRRSGRGNERVACVVDEAVHDAAQFSLGSAVSLAFVLVVWCCLQGSSLVSWQCTRRETRERKCAV